MQKNIIELKDVARYYEMGESVVKALDCINIPIEAGDFVAIMGPSGSGKSTSMNLTGSLDLPTKGEIYLDGKKDIHESDLGHLSDAKNSATELVKKNNNWARISCAKNGKPLVIEEINKSRKAHIITVEDPVEFLFEDKESLIEQREIGLDTKSFAEALKHVLRQDPNVILVGEMRDPETISTVLTAAETGHLVFSTLHTSSAAEAVERIVDVFEGPKQQQVLIQLSSVLRAVVAQQLIPGKDGSRVAAREILINTPSVANLIKENNIAQIKSAIQTGAKDGMITMENSLKQLEKEGLIDAEMADKRMGRQRKI